MPVLFGVWRRIPHRLFKYLGIEVIYLRSSEEVQKSLGRLPQVYFCYS